MPQRYLMLSVTDDQPRGFTSCSKSFMEIDAYAIPSKYLLYVTAPSEQAIAHLRNF